MIGRSVGRRWCSNVAAFVVSMSALLAGSAGLAWAIPHALTLGVFDELAPGDQARPGAAAEPSGVQRVLEAVRGLHTAVTDPQAVRALDRALCAGLPTQALASVSIVVGEDETTQAVIMAMPPGAGTWAASEVAASWPQCLGRTSSAGSPWMPSWAAASHAWGSYTAVWSRGDVVVIGSGLDEEMSQIDDVLRDALIEHQCLDLSPPVEAYLENPDVAGQDYRHPTRAVRVDVDPIVPLDHSGQPLEPPASDEIPRADRPVEVPVMPPGRTYWPDLPPPVQYPVVEPVLARPAAVTTIDVDRADPLGPGCGWEFAAYVPAITKDASPEQVAVLSEQARADLTQQWHQWAESVERFWANRDDYVAAVAAYGEYRDAVTEIAFRWEFEVAPLWDAYEQQMEQYTQAVQERRAWLERRDSAQQEWNEFLATCVPEVETDANTAPDGGAATAPSPTPRAHSGATPCDSRTAPAILFEQEPDMPDLPEIPTPDDETPDPQNAP